MRLGELLIREGHATAAQVQEAMRAQVIYGARIGTNLIELGHVHIDTLAETLGHQHHLAAALSKHFDSADRELQRRFPPVLAAELEAVPLREELPGVVAVAFLDPPAPEPLRRIGEALSSEIVPVITPELRLRYQLEEVYGLPRPNRYVRVAPRQAPEPQEDLDSERTRRRYISSLSDQEPQLPDPGTLGRVALARKSVRRDVPAAPREATQLDNAATVDEAIAGIRRATERDRVIELAVSGMRGDFDRILGAGLVLLVREDMAIGWGGFSRHADDDVIQTIAIPLAEPSVLRLAYQSQVLVCGKPPANGELIDRRLWHMLGSEPPEECVVAPIVIQGRAVCLVYAHHRNRGPVPDHVNDAVARLAEEASTAFLRLIRSAQR